MERFTSLPWAQLDQHRSEPFYCALITFFLACHALALARTRTRTHTNSRGAFTTFQVFTRAASTQLKATSGTMAAYITSIVALAVAQSPASPAVPLRTGWQLASSATVGADGAQVRSCSVTMHALACNTKSHELDHHDTDPPCARSHLLADHTHIPPVSLLLSFFAVGVFQPCIQLIDSQRGHA
jgi:hypothetical protein